MKIKILLLLVPFLFVSNVESGSYKGRATIELPKRLCTKDNRPKERSLHLQAIEEAKIIAWNNYINTFSRKLMHIIQIKMPFYQNLMNL